MGWAVLDVQGSTYRLAGSGVVKPAEAGIVDRVTAIYGAVEALLDEWRPDCLAIEDVFYEKNVQSAIKLAYARAAVFIAVRRRGLAVYEYSPAEVKKTLVGNGRAEKEQVAYMVRVLTGVSKPMAPDESDAVGLAVCHAHHGTGRLA
jgi:crossover junction endodeoxyribonuclease RuvC